ncbi:MAG: cobalamin-independent methionine synthase II family protein [Candidatus Latescibacteria bacterium]|jgi:5-methyltetrahydropteroyltriglutamate--homocysteine methyltransferase|nr:cobalamin-independent methionine synthase II family protein [Candidatus Latescibacterota bacterium]
MSELFPTSVVGSMPRSQFVRDLLAPAHQSELSEAELTRRIDAAVAYIISLQEQAGIDIISDGEWRRLSYIGIIADIMDGFERTMVDGLYWHTVIAPMESKSPGLVAREAAFLKSKTDRKVKVALPSPYLLGQRMWDPERSKSAYPTREAFMKALVPVLRSELIAVRDAGVDVVQFDDPHLCLFVDERVRKTYDDADREVALCVDMLNEILDGVDGITSAVHLCRRNKGRDGWVGEGGYGPIIPALQRLNVDQYVMEFTIPVAGDLAVLQELPENTMVGLGCVDCRGEHVDTPEEIVSRVEKALEFLPPERIALNPDCGFAPGNAADIPIDEAYAKLANEARAAQILRERYG